MPASSSMNKQLPSIDKFLCSDPARAEVLSTFDLDHLAEAELVASKVVRNHKTFLSILKNRSDFVEGLGLQSNTCEPVDGA